MTTFWDLSAVEAEAFAFLLSFIICATVLIVAEIGVTLRYKRLNKKCSSQYALMLQKVVIGKLL